VAASICVDGQSLAGVVGGVSHRQSPGAAFGRGVQGLRVLGVSSGSGAGERLPVSVLNLEGWGLWYVGDGGFGCEGGTRGQNRWHRREAPAKSLASNRKKE